MKFDIKWLQKYINLKLTPEELGVKLTDAGLEIEAIDGSVLDLKVPANRADCLGIVGIAREVAALTDQSFTEPAIKPVADKITDQIKIKVEAGAACPRYIGRIIKNIDNTKPTPQWIKDCLAAADIKSISAVVDITNYILLEYGQPLHAFDLNKINQEIVVRFARANEKLTLLDGAEVQLTPETLLIADSKQALAIAGIKGGLDSGIAANTKDIILECAYFEPVGVRLTSRHLGVKTDSSYRFERGIDPMMQEKVMQHFTQLILDIVGGEAGPLVEVADVKHIPVNAAIKLRSTRVAKILGINLNTAEISALLQRLNFVIKPDGIDLMVQAPSFRTDIAIEEDLIEEIGRVYGLNNIPSTPSIGTLDFVPAPENNISDQAIANCLVNRGYNEAITYSFIDQEFAKVFNPNISQDLILANPISSEMSLMRPSLLPGLIQTIQYNLNRQQARVRLFEIGLRYIGKEVTQQIKTIAGACYGLYAPEGWANSRRTNDFYDLQQDLMTLLALGHNLEDVEFKACSVPCWHPHQAADICVKGKTIGHMGALHPRIQQQLGLLNPVYMFELDYAAIANGNTPVFKAFSKYPAVRRDVAVLLARDLPAAQIELAIKQQVGSLLSDLVIFDVYQGKGIPENQKSMALGITLQHMDRTLTDNEVNEIFANVITLLQNKFNATLR